MPNKEKVNKLIKPSYAEYKEPSYSEPVYEEFNYTDAFSGYSEEKVIKQPSIADYTVHPEFSQGSLANAKSWKGVIDPVSKEEILGWIEALESGEYNGRIVVGRLQDPSGDCSFCALGVFANQRGDLPDGAKAFDEKGGSGGSLVSSKGVHAMPNHVQSAIYSHNDATGKPRTPKEIADNVRKIFGV